MAEHQDRPNRMDLERFEDLLDRFGGDLGSWPAELRTAAEELCAESADAAQMLAVAQALDMMLAAPPTISASPALAERILAAAPKPVPQAPVISSSRGRRPLLEALWPFGPVWRPAAALAGAAMLGVVLGYAVPGPAEPADTGFAFEVASIDEVVEFAVGLDQDLEVIE